MSYSGAWTLSFEIKFHLDIQNSGVIFDIQTPGDITEEAFLRQFYADAEVNGLIKERLQPKDYESLGNRLYKELKEFKRNQKIRYHDLYQMPLTHIGVRHGMTYWSVVEYTRLHLLKLHGSINWFYSGKTQFPGEQLYYAEGLAELNEYQTKTDLVPFIIPPVLDKGEFYQHNAIRQIWETAGSHLRNATHIYVIGYSFPETDLASRFLLQQNISENSKIFLINKTSDKKVLIERACKLIPDFIINSDYVKNEEVLYPFIEDLTKGDLSNAPI
jgi:hypothetical protein